MLYHSKIILYKYSIHVVKNKIWIPFPFRTALEEYIFVQQSSSFGSSEAPQSHTWSEGAHRKWPSSHGRLEQAGVELQKGMGAVEYATGAYCVLNLHFSPNAFLMWSATSVNSSSSQYMRNDCIVIICKHAFFSQRLSRVIGHIYKLLIFTIYEEWLHYHNMYKHSLPSKVFPLQLRVV